MPYQIGQYRRQQQIDQYSEDLGTVVIKDQEKTNQTFGTTLSFIDKIATQTTANNKTIDLTVNNQNCYYLYFTVKRMSTKQNFYLKLINTSATGATTEQLIDTYQVEESDNSNSVVHFETIISPNATYNGILWELQRNNDDLSGNKRVMNVTVNNFTRLKNILSTLNIQRLTKVGIQGPPSLLMCINREPIRIGRNGIYELNNGIDITSISFVPKFVPKNNSSGSNVLDYFIMDFEY